MIEFLRVEVLILFWIFVTLGMLCFAYYARNEAIQKVASTLFVTFVITHIFDGNIGKIPFFVATDLACLAYCLYLWRTLERSNPVPLMVATVFATMLVLHAISDGPSFGYGLSLSVLYAAQLVVLCAYSHQYGKIARIASPIKGRDDMFYKAVLWLKPTKISH